jgi:SAM-dependent methyltransferase
MKVAEQLRALVHSGSHFGAAIAVLRRVAGRGAAGRALVGRLERLAERYTDHRTRAFDRKYGTDTFERSLLSEIEIKGGFDPAFGTWMYGPINQDFFREMMRALPVRFQDYGFYDVGAGKGLALMLASEYGFRELVGIEFSPPLVEAGKKNVAIFERKVGRSLGVEWVCDDFMQWEIPNRPALFFMNAPFPHDIAVRAIRHVEESLAAHPRPAILLYRKAHGDTVKVMDASPQLRPLAASLFWRAYASRSL